MQLATAEVLQDTRDNIVALHTDGACSHIRHDRDQHGAHCPDCGENLADYNC